MDTIRTAEQAVQNLFAVSPLPSLFSTLLQVDSRADVNCTTSVLSSSFSWFGGGSILKESHRICWPVRVIIRTGICSETEFWCGFYIKKENSVGVESWKEFQEAGSQLTITMQAASRELMEACHFPFHPKYTNGWERMLSRGLWDHCRGQPLGWAVLFTRFNSNLCPYLGLNSTEKLPMCTDRKQLGSRTSSSGDCRLHYSDFGKGEGKKDSFQTHSLL